MNNIAKVVIIGSGPAGLTAAIYSARANLSPMVFAGVSFGGQLMTTTLVENYPGFPDGVDGPELMQMMIKQAEKFGTKLVYETVQSVDFSSRPFKLVTQSGSYQAQSVIVASGAESKMLGIPSEKEFWGRGVSTCATCDGAFYKNKVVAVVGGGDSAMEESLFLTHFATKVYLIHRRDKFRASKIMQDRVLAHPQIEVLWNTEIEEIVGGQFVEGLKIINNVKHTNQMLPVDGLFLAIGHIPTTTFLKGQLNLDEQGYVVTPDGVYTSVEGVFVAGDVADHTYKQAITAAGMGCKAAITAERWLGSQNI